MTQNNILRIKMPIMNYFHHIWSLRNRKEIVWTFWFSAVNYTLIYFLFISDFVLKFSTNIILKKQKCTWAARTRINRENESNLDGWKQSSVCQNISGRMHEEFCSFLREQITAVPTKKKEKKRKIIIWGDAYANKFSNHFIKYV